MTALAFDHVNIRTARLREQVEFYTKVIGLTLGPRPAFPFPGAWLYLGSRACLHLVETPTAPNPEGALRLEHFAFTAQNLTRFLATLDEWRVPYRLSALLVPEGDALIERTVVNLADPDGNRLHLDFPGETAPCPAPGS